MLLYVNGDIKEISASLSGLSFQRLNSPVSHNVNKVGKKGTMPVRGLYLEKSSYQTEFQMKHIDKEIASPNRDYAHKYKDYLELNNRKPRTTAKRMNEIRVILRYLPPDAKLATKEDIGQVVLAINNAKRRDMHGNETNVDIATISKSSLQVATLR
jgi:hypothetical protein